MDVEDGYYYNFYFLECKEKVVTLTSNFWRPGRDVLFCSPPSISYRMPPASQTTASGML